MEDNYTKPLYSLETSMAFDTRDWSQVKRDAWLYGIICGWENENPLVGEKEDDALIEICEKHGLDRKRLKSLRNKFKKLFIIESNGSGVLWRPYILGDSSSYPKQPKKYLVKRKDGKIHFEMYNGTGWAYNNNSITDWCELNHS